MGDGSETANLLFISCTCESIKLAWQINNNVTTLSSIIGYYFPSAEVPVLKEIIAGSLYTVIVSSLNCVLIYWRMYSLFPPPIHLAYITLFVCRMLQSRRPLGFDPPVRWLAGVFRGSGSGRFAPAKPQENVCVCVSLCVSANFMFYIKCVFRFSRNSRRVRTKKKSFLGSSFAKYWVRCTLYFVYLNLHMILLQR